MLSVTKIEEFNREVFSVGSVDSINAEVKQHPHIYLKAIVEGLMKSYELDIDYIEQVVRHEAQTIKQEGIQLAIVEQFIGSEEDMKNE